MDSLKEIRKEMGLTQAQAAELIGVSRRTYQSYEKMGAYETNRIEKLKKAGFDKNGNPAILSIRFIKKTASEIFAQYQQVECAYLFGSYARGEADFESDVDFLIVEKDMSLLDMGGLLGKLREALHKDVDLVTHESILDNERMIRDVLRQGVKVYGRRISVSKN